MLDFAFVIAGFVVGTIIGLTGVGGGSLMTPLLIVFFGVKPYMAVGTDLLFAALTKMGGTLSFARQRIVPWRAVGLLSLGSIPAALVTVGALRWLGQEATPTLPELRMVTAGREFAGVGWIGLRRNADHSVISLSALPLLPPWLAMLLLLGTVVLAWRQEGR